MRYIILFVIAIVLPVLAFFNFTKNDEIGEDTWEEQTASISLRTSEDTGAGSGTDVHADLSPAKVQEYTDLLLDEVFGGAKDQAGGQGNAETQKANVVSEEFVDEGPQYKLPKITYVEPSQFPLTTTITQPYLERLQNPSFSPIRNWDVQIEDIDAASALAIEPGSQKVLYHKHIFDSRPIASLSKLMTALVLVEEMDLQSEVLISKNAVATYGEAGSLVVGETLTVGNLLYVLLVASSNDAAVALEEYYNAFRIQEDQTFVAAMNRRAYELDLLDTFFVEPSGLNGSNRSTAFDLARLADFAFRRPIIRQVMSTQVIDVQSVDGIINHHLINSNKLLGVLPGVLAGKTGYTEEAGESIVLYLKKSDDADDYLIYVILGSEDRVKAARHLIEWVQRAYVWE